MSHAIPVFATRSDPVQNPPVQHPVGDLFAELFWVTASGQIAKELGSVPVQNGVAIVDGTLPPAGLLFAIRILRPASSGAVFRSGPLTRLPGPPSPVISTGAVSFLFSGVSFSLSTVGSDGVPELLAQHLQPLPWPMEFRSIELDADEDGNYLVTVRGRRRGSFPFWYVWRPFTYRRAVRLVGSLDPGRPKPPVIAALIDPPVNGGADVSQHAAVLDRLIKEGVERQLDFAVTRIAGLQIEFAGAGIGVETVSVSKLEVGRGGNQPEAGVSMTLSGGAITGVLAPPVLNS
jgi:hypothetical protein